MNAEAEFMFEPFPGGSDTIKHSDSQYVGDISVQLGFIKKFEKFYLNTIRISSKKSIETRGRFKTSDDEKAVAVIALQYVSSFLELKDRDKIKVSIGGIKQESHTYSIDSLIININDKPFEPLLELRPGEWMIFAKVSQPVVAAAASGGAGASGGAASTDGGTFEPIWVKRAEYGDCVIQCPECKFTSGSGLILGHNYDCSNKDKTPNLSNKVVECAKLGITVKAGGARRTHRRRHRRQKKSRRHGRKRV